MSHYSQKQDELYLRQVKSLLKIPANKKCFDCSAKCPTYANMTLHTFICTRCSGLVRSVGHRIKSISASTFTGQEASMLKLGGNAIAQTIWLSKYGANNTSDLETDSDVCSFMHQKYVEKKWLDPVLLHMHEMSAHKAVNPQSQEDGTPKSRSRRVAAQCELQEPLLFKQEDLLPEFSTATASIGTLDLEPPPARKSPATQIRLKTPKDMSLGMQPVVSPSPSSSNDVFSDLAGLEPFSPCRSATYTGGILTPTYSPVTTPTSPVFLFHTESPALRLPVNDPYVALRNLSLDTSATSIFPQRPEPHVLRSDDTSAWIGGEEWVEAESFDPAPKVFNTNVFHDLDPLVQYRRDKHQS